MVASKRLIDVVRAFNPLPEGEASWSRGCLLPAADPVASCWLDRTHEDVAYITLTGTLDILSEKGCGFGAFLEEKDWGRRRA